MAPRPLAGSFCPDALEATTPTSSLKYKDIWSVSGSIGSGNTGIPFKISFILPKRALKGDSGPKCNSDLEDCDTVAASDKSRGGHKPTRMIFLQKQLSLIVVDIDVTVEDLSIIFLALGSATHHNGFFLECLRQGKDARFKQLIHIV
jgi:hypothetical protein